MIVSRRRLTGILAGALISITLNSLMFKAIGPLEVWIEAHIHSLPALARFIKQDDPLASGKGKDCILSS